MTRRTAVLALFVLLILAAYTALPGCTEDDDDGGRVGTSGDDDDSGDDDSGGDDDDLDPDDCPDVLGNPYCLEGLTYEMADVELDLFLFLFTFRPIFIRFDTFDLNNMQYAGMVVAGTAANPSQPEDTGRESCTIAGVGAFSISLSELLLPVDLEAADDKSKSEVSLTLTDVTITGIMVRSGLIFEFGSIAGTIPGSWFQTNLTDVCDAVPDICENGYALETEQMFTGELREDARW